ncbi:MAG: ribonuclease Y, partial [Crocinitomicaceae bacterium]|nr:ribonuclease Y [Crocinitomicaceae bacterium]
MSSVGLIIGLLSGAGATVVAQRFLIKSKSQEIIKNAEIEAENIRKERALQSKEKFLKQKEEHEESIRERE